MAFPLDPGDPAGGAVAFRLVGVCAGTDAAEYQPENLPRAAAQFESAYEGGHGWGVERRASWGRDNSRGRPLRSTHELTHPQSDVAVNHAT